MSQGGLSAKKASKLNFNEWVAWQLEKSANGIIADFQVSFLTSSSSRKVIDQSDTQRALKILETSIHFGLVEEFRLSLKMFTAELKKSGVIAPEAKVEVEPHVNITSFSQGNDETEAKLRENLETETYKELKRRNRQDLELYARAKDLFWSNISK